MPTTFDNILKWTSRLPYWERAALEKVISSGTLTEQDYDQLVHFFLQDFKLEVLPPDRPALQFLQRPANAPAPIRLSRLFNLKNINALPSDQELRFSPQLTVVFGANGSGKTGYARVLACAAFARGERRIFPDVRQAKATGVAEADIEITDGSTPRTIHFRESTRRRELSSFYVFDAKSVAVHLTAENTLAVYPAGLAYLTELANATDGVRDRLRREIQRRRAPHNLQQFFQGESKVSKAISALSDKTDLKILQALATLSEGEVKQIEQLKVRIATIQAEKVPEKIRSLRQQSADLVSLKKALQDTLSKLDDVAVSKIAELMKLWRAQKVRASQAGVDQFRSEWFTQVGTADWDAFIKAARRLSVAESSLHDPYPHDGDHCLLCQQALGSDAIKLLHRFWEYLASDAQKTFEQTEHQRQTQQTGFRSLNVAFFTDASPSHRILSEMAPALLQSVIELLAVCNTRRDYVLRLLDDENAAIKAEPKNTILDDISALAQRYQQDADQLEKLNQSEQAKVLEAELRELQHRKSLGDCFQSAHAYVENCSWCATVESKLGSTAHITLQQNKLFEELVTDQYLNTFQAILATFNRPLTVSIQTRGQKGKHMHRLVLEALPGASAATPLDEILSDGEKHAVALADFLTEVAVDADSSGVLLDDPVTSLDAEWKEAFARLLVNEAVQRQVVLFTHDLHFLYLINKHSAEREVTTSRHWIQRSNDGSPGSVFLDNGPACELDYRNANIADRLYSQSLKLLPDQQQIILRAGFGALRTSYEVFVAHDLLNGVVRRFEEQIRVPQLRDIAWDETIVQEAIQKFEELSRYIEAHSHSDQFAQTKPTPALLLQEIEAYKALKGRWKEVRKQRTSQVTALRV